MSKQVIVIDNRTDIPTRALRKLVKFVAKQKGIDYNLRIIFKPKRKRWGQSQDNPSGWAYIGKIYTVGSAWQKHENLKSHGHVIMHTPTSILHSLYTLDGFLQVFEHELDHTLGLKHGDMVPIDDIDISRYFDRARAILWGGPC